MDGGDYSVILANFLFNIKVCWNLMLWANDASHIGHAGDSVIKYTPTTPA